MCLFYVGQVCVLFGDSESAKTWLAYVATAEVLEDDGRAFVLDADHNGAEHVVGRFIALGVPEAVLADPDRFRLYEPEDGAALREAVAECKDWEPDIAVVDSVGEVLPLLGLSSNSPDDYTEAHRIVLRPFAVRGACVLAIDHLAKGAESRAQGASGTLAKKRAVAISLRVSLEDAFSPGQVGRSVLSIHKDRHGGLRRESPPAKGGGEQVAGVFVLDSTGDVLRWHVEAPTEGAEFLRSDMIGTEVTDDELRAVLALPEDRRTTRPVREALKCNRDRAGAVVRAYKALTREQCSALLTPVPGSGEQ